MWLADNLHGASRALAGCCDGNACNDLALLA
jgi:hypothetical protein